MTNLKKTSTELVAEAFQQIETLDVKDVHKQSQEDKILLVDIRDSGELTKEGKIESAFHCPRGLIEFWIDPENPNFKKQFDTDKKLVLFCALGSRSALATKTLQDMGITNIAHIKDGFKAWKDSGFPVSVLEPPSFN